MTLSILKIGRFVCEGIPSGADLKEQITSKFTFAPTKTKHKTPAERGIPHEEIFVKTPDDEKLHGYFLPAKEKTDKVMLFFHGHDENVALWHLAPVNLQQHINVNALIVDYRGYGKSTGKPSTDGIITDALAMYDYLILRGFKPEDISVYGRSMGAAVALEVASRVPVRLVVFQSGFYSFKEHVKELYPYVPSCLIKDDFLDSASLIKKIKAPILICHGSKDERVHYNHAYRLFNIAPFQRKLIILEGAGHEHLKKFFTEEYFTTLKNLMTQSSLVF